RQEPVQEPGQHERHDDAEPLHVAPTHRMRGFHSVRQAAGSAAWLSTAASSMSYTVRLGKEILEPTKTLITYPNRRPTDVGRPSAQPVCRSKGRGDGDDDSRPQRSTSETTNPAEAP